MVYGMPNAKRYGNVRARRRGTIVPHQSPQTRLVTKNKGKNNESSTNGSFKILCPIWANESYGSFICPAS
jgi:hypothetical protein